VQNDISNKNDGYAKELTQWAQQTVAIDKYNTALDASVATYKQRLAVQTATLGMGSKEAQQYQQLSALQQHFADQAVNLAQQLAQKGTSEPVIQA